MSEVKNFNKGDFINLIAEQSGIAKVDASKAIECFTKGVEAIVEKGDKLTLVGFGSFYIAENKARDGRNPSTGEVIKLAASKTPKFKAGAALKKLCNK